MANKGHSGIKREIQNAAIMLWWTAISTFYVSRVGANPVILLDWRRLIRAIRNQKAKIIKSVLFLYVAVPVAVVIAGKSNSVFTNYLGLTASQNGISNILFDLYFGLVYLIIILHYLSICILNLVNPLGKFYGDAAVEDAPVAPGYARQFITARLIPRLSIFPLILYVTYGIILGRQWAIDMALGGFLLLHLFTVFSAIIAFTHLLSFAIFVQVFVSNSSIRFVIITAFVIISVFTYNPESLLAAIKTFAGADGKIVFLPYLLFWGFSPFGTIEAVERFYLDWTSEFSRFMDPRIAIAVRACVQICVIAAIIFAARIRFRKVFPPPRA